MQQFFVDKICILHHFVTECIVIIGVVLYIFIIAINQPMFVDEWMKSIHSYQAY